MFTDFSSNKHKQRGAGSLLVVLTVVLTILAGYLVFKMQGIDTRLKEVEKTVAGAQPQPEQPIDLNKVKALFKKGNMTFGDAKSKVLVAEFSDPSCPFCHAAAYGADEIFQGRFKTVANGGEYMPPVQEFRKLAQEGKIGYVALYANGHGNGEIAQQGLYCAYEQNKYWEAHDLLFSQAGYDLINNTVKNDKAKIPDLVNYLSSAVDATALQSCLESGKYANKLNEDMQTAQTVNFSGTPMFVVNTTKFAGAYSYKDIEPAVKGASK